MKPYQDGYTPQARDIHHRASAALLVALGPLNDRIAQGLAEALLCMAVDIFEKYPGTQVEKVIWSRLMMEANPETVNTYTDLMARLHHLEIHPDYEYKQLTPSVSSEPNVPKGHGWELNPHYSPTLPGSLIGWYRLKEDAKKDDIDVLSLPAITIPKMNLQTYLGYLRETIVKGYMPSAKRDGHMSKPCYVDRADYLARLDRGSGIYSYSWDMGGIRKEEFGALKVQEQRLYCCIDFDGLYIITDLKSESNTTYYSVQRQDGTWMEYSEWFDRPYFVLPLDPSKIKQELDKM